MALQVSDGVDRLADPDPAGSDAPDAAGLGLRGLGAVRDRIGVWRALFDRPLTSYYLVLGTTTLLLGQNVHRVSRHAQNVGRLGLDNPIEPAPARGRIVGNEFTAGDQPLCHPDPRDVMRERRQR